MTTHDACAKKANRKSAVERLEESKSNYVKTVSVLDCKQKFEHSSTLHVSTSPKIDVLLGIPIKSSHHSQSSSQSEGHRNDLPIIKRTKLRSSIFDGKLKAFRKSETINKTSSLTDFDCQIFSYQDNKESTKPAVSLPKVDYYNLRSRYECSRGTGSPRHHQRNQFEFPQHDSSSNEERYRTCLDAEYSTHEQSEEEEPSTDGTRDSLSVGDIMEFEDKGVGSKTSDYVSRSSSFKCSDRVRNLVDRFETQLSQSKREGTKMKTTSKRKSVSRSKSDVSHSFSRGLGLHSNKINNDSDLENFFNTMGLDTTSWNNLTSLPSSPAHFFDSISSVNSDDHLSSICSEGSAGETPKEGLTNRDLLRHAPTETSIVEKNARVVKWLYNCHNARREYSTKKF